MREDAREGVAKWPIVCGEAMELEGEGESAERLRVWEDAELGEECVAVCEDWSSLS